MVVYPAFPKSRKKKRECTDRSQELSDTVSISIQTCPRTIVAGQNTKTIPPPAPVGRLHGQSMNSAANNVQLSPASTPAQHQHCQRQLQAAPSPLQQQEQQHVPQEGARGALDNSLTAPVMPPSEGVWLFALQAFVVCPVYNFCARARALCVHVYVCVFFSCDTRSLYSVGVRGGEKR